MEYNVKKHMVRWMSLFFIVHFATMCTSDFINNLIIDFQPKEHVFMVHGTFGKDQSWYQRGGDFYNAYISQIEPHAKVHSFKWSGRCSHAHRVRAAQELASYIQWTCNPHDTITLIGHSHGGNVCIMAINILIKQFPQYKIDTVFSLGTPVSFESLYTPNMQHIKKLYHLFSFGDLVQPVFNLYDRVFNYHPRLWNIEVYIKGKLSNHSDLRSPIIVDFLQQVHLYLLENDSTVLHLHGEGSISFESDYQRQELIIFEKENFDNMFPEALSRKFNIHECTTH